MNRATSPTGWVRNPVMKSPELDPMQASSYELGWTFNPITGCLNHDNGLCKGGGFPCYAFKLAHGRLKQRYLANHCLAVGAVEPSELQDFYGKEKNPFYPRFWEERLYHDWGGKRGIFVCDMGELFGDRIPRKWQEDIFRLIKLHKGNRYYLLTKQPQNLIKFSPFPENCFVGVTATNTELAWIASKRLSQIEARVKFLSIEPLLSWETGTPYTTENIVAGLDGSLDWLIIGACTGTKKEMVELCLRYPELTLTLMLWGKRWTAQPRIEWVREIVEAADKAGIKVFLKDNLRPLLPEEEPFYTFPWGNDPEAGIAELRQEMP